MHYSLKYPHFIQVDDLFIFWEWVEHTFVPTLKPSYWYGPYTDPAENDLWTDAVQQQTRSKRRSRKLRTKAKGGAPSVINYVSVDLKKYPKGFTADHATAYMVGAPRLRQLRVIDSKFAYFAIIRLYPCKVLNTSGINGFQYCTSNKI